jgi:hypothetical protein
MIPWKNVPEQITVGGFTNVAPIVDLQSGPTCGFEAIENIIQLFYPVSNNLSRGDLLQRALRYGGVVATENGPILRTEVYRQLLHDYQIPSRWYPFLHYQTIIPALMANRGVLIIGDAHYLDGGIYPWQGSWHAYVLTNFCTNYSDQLILSYVGIDSNFPGEERFWTCEQVASSAQMAAQQIWPLPVLITDIPASRFPAIRHYRAHRP